MMKRLAIVLTLVMFVMGGSGCTRTQKGAAIGGTAGAAVGAAIGKATGKNTAVAAIIGAAVGGSAGALIGRQMDQQAAEMEQDLEGAKIERVGEGIKVTFDSGILFDVNRADLQPAAKANLEQLAQILNKYPDTNILIEGHTDSTGKMEWNMELSKLRAESVGTYLTQLGVDKTRFTVTGYGPTQPVDSNETVEGRQNNRRVELAIMANEKMKKAAERQAASQG